MFFDTFFSLPSAPVHVDLYRRNRPGRAIKSILADAFEDTDTSLFASCFRISTNMMAMHQTAGPFCMPSVGMLVQLPRAEGMMLLAGCL